MTPTVEVKDNPAENRYEAWVDGVLAGFSEYKPKDGWLVFTHTEVKPEYEGQGVAEKLAKDCARRRPGGAASSSHRSARSSTGGSSAIQAYADLVVGTVGPPFRQRGAVPRDPSGGRELR